MPTEQPKTIHLLDFFSLLARRRAFLIGFVFAVCAGTAIYSLVVTPSYTSTVVLMPPESSQAGMLSRLSANLPFASMLGSQLMQAGDPSGVFLAVLYSRLLRTRMIERFDLVRVYKFHKARRYFIEDVLKVLDKCISVGLTEQGTIALSVEDESRERAQAMAQFMADELDSIFGARMREKASHERQFLEQRLLEVRAALAAAESSLVTFQTANKAVQIDAQTSAAIEAAARAEALYQAAQLEYEIGSKLYEPGHAQLRELKLRMSELRRQADRLTNQRVSGLLIPLTMSPELGVEIVRLTRDLKIHEAVFGFLTEQYERAKLEEVRTVPHVQVLDPASLPQKRSYPKRRQMVMIAFAVSLVLGIVILLVHEALLGLRRDNPTEYGKLLYVARRIPGVPYTERLWSRFRGRGR